MCLSTDSKCAKGMCSIVPCLLYSEWLLLVTQRVKLIITKEYYDMDKAMMMLMLMLVMRAMTEVEKREIEIEIEDEIERIYFPFFIS